MALKQRPQTMTEAVKIVSDLMLRQSQIDQLRYMRDTQGQAFADQVKARVVEAGQVRKK